VRKFKKVGVKSFAKFNAFYMGLIGLIGGVFTGIPALLFGGSGMFDKMGFGDDMGSGFGIGLLIGTPLVYALIGLIAGYIGGAIINLVLKISGGIDVEVVDVETKVEPASVVEEKA